MGLASSQARLLTLTSRQHTIEAKAQRLLSEKMRLSNKSDAVYQKYMDALEDTTIKTRQINDLGETSWIDGSINNLLRYNAPETTNGTVFYVQDLESGKLYVPQEVANNYGNLTAATIPAGHEYTDAMKFAVLNGVTYTKVDNNEHIVKDYEKTIAKGWNTLLTDDQLTTYSEALYYDKGIQQNALALLGIIPEKTQINTDTGLFGYKVASYKNGIGTNYETYVNEAIDSGQYSDSEVELLRQSILVFKNFEHKSPESTKENSTVTDPIYGEGTGYIQIDYTTTNVSAGAINADHNDISDPYLSLEEEVNEFTPAQKFELMLNGGSVLWKGTAHIKYTYPWNHYSEDKNVDPPIETEVYNDEARAVLGTYTNFGDALTDLFTSKSTFRGTSDTYLASQNKTIDDVYNYQQYKRAKDAYDVYSPDYEYIPNDRVKAKYYEGIYTSINAAGGCIGVNEDIAKNADWTQGMIKNLKAILTTWDDKDNNLSKLTPSLHLDVKEVSDKHRIEKAEQDYEAENTLINAKDTDIDNMLSQLETERSAISTEMKGIEKVMDDNVKKNFTVFS